MYGWINRFKGEPGFENHLDELFGCPEWRQGLKLQMGEDQKAFFHDLYRRQLKKNGAEYVVHFELYEGNRHIYTIFFGTDGLTGCDKMKQAIWKIAPFGDCKFMGDLSNQLVLGPSVVDFSALEDTLFRSFAGKGWQRIERLTDFVKSDATPFHSSHLKAKTLKPMEAAGKIEVLEGTRRRAGTYPEGTILRFV